LDHFFHILWSGIEDLLQVLLSNFQFNLRGADLPGLDNACFSFPKSHEYASRVACDPGNVSGSRDTAGWISISMIKDV
jgi:hypothetical protein